MKEKELLNAVKDMCKNNIERIDRQYDNGEYRDVDIGMLYAYRKILDFIKGAE